MPPQIKQDLNRSGWESTDFPSVCESCLPENPYVQMLKEDYGAECKICTRPFTMFRWKADRTARTKRTNICLTCARLKNCCQCCMLDLSFGLPIVVRDAALKMVAPGPESSINREFYAQNHEKELEEGRGLEEYEKTDEKARELLKRLADSEPYHKRQRRIEAEQAAEGGAQQPPKLLTNGPGPIRTQDNRPYRGRGNFRGRGGRGSARGGRSAAGPSALPRPEDIAPPSDPNITSLFVTGVEDDLPEHTVRTHFSQFGRLRSLVCSHRSHCAFVNYQTREGAEKAAEACQGRAVIAGCPLKVVWGKPKPLDNMELDVRMDHARQGRDTAKAIAGANGMRALGQAGVIGDEEEEGNGLTAEEGIGDVAAPPGEEGEEVKYASLAGE